MSKRQVCVTFISGSVAALLSVGVAAQGGAPSPLPSPSQNVNVTNVPLPVTGNVTGTVSVSGTVPVSLTNTPLPVMGTVGLTSGTTVHSQQSGSWNVGINGPVTVVAAVPTQPFVFHSDPTAFARAFGPAAPSTRLAITSVILANGHPSNSLFVEVYVDGCDGSNKAVYLMPLIPAQNTVALSFTSPLVVGSSGTWCLTVSHGSSGALNPFTIVGYVLP
jgi:hypothetical protein